MQCRQLTSVRPGEGVAILLMQLVSAPPFPVRVKVRIWADVLVFPGFSLCSSLPNLIWSWAGRFRLSWVWSCSCVLVRTCSYYPVLVLPARRFLVLVAFFFPGSCRAYLFWVYSCLPFPNRSSSAIPGLAVLVFPGFGYGVGSGHFYVI